MNVQFSSVAAGHVVLMKIKGVVVIIIILALHN